MVTVQDDDSDAEEMQRIIQEDKVYSDSEEDKDEDEEDDDEDMEDEQDLEDIEEQEDEDEEMNSASSDEEVAGKGTSGKQTLKARIKEEQEIRRKE